MKCGLTQCLECRGTSPGSLHTGPEDGAAGTGALDRTRMCFIKRMRAHIGVLLAVCWEAQLTDKLHVKSQ